jgi:hypothetical protein
MTAWAPGNDGSAVVFPTSGSQFGSAAVCGLPPMCLETRMPARSGRAPGMAGVLSRSRSPRHTWRHA